MATNKQLDPVDYYFNEINGDTICKGLFVNPETEETEESFREKLETGLKSDNEGILKGILDTLLETNCGEFMGFNNIPEKIKEIKKLLGIKVEPDYTTIRRGSKGSLNSGDYTPVGNEEQSGDIVYNSTFFNQEIIELLKKSRELNIIKDKTAALQTKLERYNDASDDLKEKIRTYIESGVLEEPIYAMPSTQPIYNNPQDNLTPFDIFDGFIENTTVEEIIKELKTNPKEHNTWRFSKPKLAKCYRLLQEDDESGFDFNKKTNRYILKHERELRVLLMSKYSFTIHMEFLNYLKQGCPTPTSTSTSIPTPTKIFKECYHQNKPGGDQTENANAILRFLIDAKTEKTQYKYRLRPINEIEPLQHKSILRDFTHLTPQLGQLPGLLNSKIILEDLLSFLKEGTPNYPVEFKLKGKPYKYPSFHELLIDNTPGSLRLGNFITDEVIFFEVKVTKDEIIKNIFECLIGLDRGDGKQGFYMTVSNYNGRVHDEKELKTKYDVKTLQKILDYVRYGTGKETMGELVNKIFNENIEENIKKGRDTPHSKKKNKVKEIKYYLEQVEDGKDTYKKGKYVLQKSYIGSSYPSKEGISPDDRLANLEYNTLIKILNFVKTGKDYTVTEKGEQKTVKDLLNEIYEYKIVENQPQPEQSQRYRKTPKVGYGFSGGARKLSKKRSTQKLRTNKRRNQTSNRKLLKTQKRSTHKRRNQTSNRKRSTQKRSRKQTSNRKLLQKRSTQTRTQKRSTQKRSTQKRSRKATRKNRK